MILLEIVDFSDLGENQRGELNVEWGMWKTEGFAEERAALAAESPNSSGDARFIVCFLSKEKEYSRHINSANGAPGLSSLSPQMGMGASRPGSLWLWLWL